MDVFQDLIEELRDENLLEETVIDFAALTGASPVTSNGHSNGNGNGSELAEDEPSQTEADFYRKRAIDEVSSLQMVEHVLSGIEREYLKVVPAVFDDLQAKKALHQFIQVHADPTSAEYAEAEFRLMRETEGWMTALSERDKKISPANLRRFCENSRPVLSSQALMALGRFYRNSAYTEVGRSKFDLVMTRLFTREIDDSKRRLLFSRVDMVGHIKTLYANWASVALYSTEDSTLRTRTVVAGFEECVSEIEKNESFENLINSDFFDKLHQFKEATGEMFFTPEIVGAAIDCNVRIGNRFVDLIRLERERSSIERIEEKYGFEYDQVISDAAGKTLQLVDLLKSLPEEDADDNPTEPVQPVAAKPSKVFKDNSSSRKSGLFQVNKWLLLLTILVAGSSAGLYFWADQSGPEASSAETAADVSFAKSALKEYLRTGRATKENLYAITLPSWDSLSDEKKKEVLAQALEFANSNGLKSVNILNPKGRTVGFASQNRSELLNPGP
ncbi:MAG TPA: hypothetical protein VJV05_14525 [Pyrinomonadaceae bacterium]|nr:hypothetical protein [Pyrinomonadaceae bacterium]